MNARRLIIAVALVGFLGGARPAGAMIHVLRTDSWLLPTNQVHRSQIAAWAETADVQGILTDDVFLVTQHAAFSGECRKDVWVLAKRWTANADALGAVEIGGRAAGHVRVAADVLTVTGEIGGDLLALAGEVRIGRDARIRGDLQIQADRVTLLGACGGSAKIRAGRITFGGTIRGDANLAAGDIVFQQGARVGGNLLYLCPNAAPQAALPAVGGETSWSAPPPVRTNWRLRLSIQALLYLATMVLGLALIGLAPAATGAAVQRLRASWLKSFGLGLAGFALAVLLAPLAAATLFGLSLALAIWAAAGLLFLLSPVVVGLWLGSRLTRRRGSQGFASALMALSTGLLPLYLLGMIPGFAVPVAILLIFPGAGAIAAGWFQRLPKT